MSQFADALQGDGLTIEMDTELWRLPGLSRNDMRFRDALPVSQGPDQSRDTGVCGIFHLREKQRNIEANLFDHRVDPFDRGCSS